MSSSSPGSRSEQGALPGLPRWVKIFLIVAAALVVLLVAGMLIGGGQHGPGRHLNSTGGLDAAATANQVR